MLCQRASKCVLDKETVSLPQTTFLQNAVNQFPIIYYVALSEPDGVQSKAKKQMPAATVHSQEGKQTTSLKHGTERVYEMNIKFLKITQRNGAFSLLKAAS